MVADQDTISGEGLISDDSSFYDDSEPPTPPPYSTDYWTYQHSLPQYIALQSTAQAPRAAATLFNPWSHLETARQLSESIPDFLQRLPPSASPGVGWIWIANPHEHGKRRGGGGVERAEHPAELQRGTELLAAYLVHKRDTEAAIGGKSAAVISRRLRPQLLELEENLRDAAKNAGCVTGKWMLFPQTEDVDATWKIVAEAVAADRLGVGAKVASDSERDPNTRLVCVYTRDWSDRTDVKMVLEELVELGLVKTEGAGSRPIFYKSDAYTNWAIESDNEYGLRASMYSSRDVLKWNG